MLLVSLGGCQRETVGFFLYTSWHLAWLFRIFVNEQIAIIKFYDMILLHLLLIGVVLMPRGRGPHGPKKFRKRNKK